MATDHEHDYFAFEPGPNPPPEEGSTEEVVRPEGEDDLKLFDPVLDALKTVQDPEIPVNLVELGLIYELLVKQGGIVFVEMTLTTPSCPVAASRQRTALSAPSLPSSALTCAPVISLMLVSPAMRSARYRDIESANPEPRISIATLAPWLARNTAA